MSIRADNQRRWQLPYGIVTLWSAYVLMFLGGVYLLAREHAAVHHAAAYANESILWDVSQLQRELLRLADDVYRFEHDAEVHAALHAFFATKTKQQAYTEAQHY